MSELVRIVGLVVDSWEGVASIFGLGLLFVVVRFCVFVHMRCVLPWSFGVAVWVVRVFLIVIGGIWPVLVGWALGSMEVLVGVGLLWFLSWGRVSNVC